MVQVLGGSGYAEYYEQVETGARRSRDYVDGYRDPRFGCHLMSL